MGAGASRETGESVQQLVLLEVVYPETNTEALAQLPVVTSKKYYIL